jgi:DnaJ-domain-containing protein 1
VGLLPFIAVGFVGLVLLGRRESAGVAAARALLGVRRGASRAEVEEAWRERMRQAHPDRGGAPGEAVALNAARDKLLKT